MKPSWILPLAIVLLVAAAAEGIDVTQAAGAPPPGTSEAVFAGGCFWTMEHVFDEVAGVSSVTVGYTGGLARSPSYQQVEAGVTGHVEAVRVLFDPHLVSYESLLTVYWRHIDPGNGAGQFCDVGPMYRPIIFFVDDRQREQAAISKRALEDSRRFPRVLTAIAPASAFWVAESSHQHFYRTHAAAYERYRAGCGRDARLMELWGELPD